MNYVAIVVAAVAAFVASVVWYAVFGNAMTELRDAEVAAAADSGTSVWTVLFVVAQSLIVAFLLAYFISRLGIVGWQGAVGVGALVWVFPAAILLGSGVYEGVPLMLAGIHAGDWLVKLLVIAVIVGVWR
jgi:hypothetical protein